MSLMPDADYQTLDSFIREVLQRVADGASSVASAHADIMHPLTAWDKGNTTEFAPWMALRLREWERS